jgi:hypothetical protein
MEIFLSLGLSVCTLYAIDVISQISGPISRVTEAVGSHGGLKQHKVKKTTELPPLFDVSKS